jgi:chaperonin GroES
MNVKPLGNNVVIEKIKGSDKLKSGLYIPETVKETSQIGKVISVGPGEYVDGVRVPMDLKAGHMVLFNKYAGSEFGLEDKKFIVMKQSDIFAILTED